MKFKNRMNSYDASLLTKFIDLVLQGLFLSKKRCLPSVIFDKLFDI